MRTIHTIHTLIILALLALSACAAVPVLTEDHDAAPMVEDSDAR